MKSSVLFATLAVFTLSSTAADAWTRIQTEADFRDKVVGRTQTAEGLGHITSAADGTVTGQWQGNAVRGRWQWHDGYWCRNLIIGTHETGTNCLRLDIRGNQLRGRQDRGRGTETITTMN